VVSDQSDAPAALPSGKGAAVVVEKRLSEFKSRPGFGANEIRVPNGNQSRVLHPWEVNILRHRPELCVLEDGWEIIKY
jgi:hypothetical protein